MAEPVPMLPAPLDTEIGRDDPPLLKRFCSTPLPEITSHCASDGVVETRLSPSRVGETGAVTIAVGTVVRQAASLRRTPQDDRAGFMSRLTTPAELHVMDIFVQAGLFPGQTPTVEVLSDLGSSEFTGVEQHRRLPIPVRVNSLGRGTLGVTASELPRAAELASWVFQVLGWDSAEFLLYRTELRFPPIAASMSMHFRLPP